ncbi:OLC1v1036839C1 [Oldenlandia corymbosa var. corymbosa]|uniref:OLC1v1036839C1 n=1 Tax=Oldenlandia corymbosa var. corymbosa TaxID=529605 RepID=A0AAV1CYY8_OLDCO|nr:OLC1v1036839C1 [Oldenlandia corymbosa var. corymbosa]
MMIILLPSNYNSQMLRQWRWYLTAVVFNSKIVLHSFLSFFSFLGTCIVAGNTIFERIDKNNGPATGLLRRWKISMNLHHQVLIRINSNNHDGSPLLHPGRLPRSHERYVAWLANLGSTAVRFDIREIGDLQQTFH